MNKAKGAVHSIFKLNGISYASSELRELAYDLVKEGSSFEKSMGRFLSNWFDESPALSVQTSGSTGTPKNILLQKQQMVNSALATGEYFDLKTGDTALLCLPVDYIAGKMMLVRAMVLGLDLDYVEPSSNPLDVTLKTYDFCAMVPLQLENSVSEIERIKKLIVGGASISKPLKEKVQGKSTTIFETYGMTETITHVAVKSISKVTEHSHSHFMALPSVVFSRDSRDCLVISAPKVAANKVVTNDTVKLISETEFEWLGRYDNVINSGGVKLFSEQIEAKLSELISNRFFVTGLADEKLGQKLVLVVEGEIDAAALSKEITDLSSLDKFEMPKAIYSLPQFLETKTGKILRKENSNLITS